MSTRTAIACLCLLATSQGFAQTLASFNFNASVPPQCTPGVAQLASVQGYDQLGPPGRRFDGSFLRSPTGNLVSFQFSNLPPHQTISLKFLFAAIDSLDGTGTFPEGDFFRVRVDGVVVFRESFANATPSQIQSYVPPPAGQLARRVDLGFSGPGSFYTDSAYDMGVESRFQNIPHSASSVVIDFIIEGPGIQDLGDESWAIDELTIELGTPAGFPCDSLDFNNDTLSPDSGDLDDFLAVLSGGPTACSTFPVPGCNDIDFNNDGLAPDSADLDAFLSRLAGGPCL